MDACRPCTPIANSNDKALYCSPGSPTRGDLVDGFQCNAGYYPVDTTNQGMNPTQCVGMRLTRELSLPCSEVLARAVFTPLALTGCGTCASGQYANGGCQQNVVNANTICTSV
jgi:hypothetical protein